MLSSIYIKKERDKKYNLGGLSKFWQLNQDGNMYILTCEDFTKKYKNMHDLHNDFISLEEFLQKAQYVGYQFYRTRPIRDEDDELDTSYMNANHYSSYFVLFSYDNIYLTYYSNDIFDHHEYIVIPKYYTEDKNYKLIGKSPLISFADKIYAEIINQENIQNNNRTMQKELTLKKD